MTDLLASHKKEVPLIWQKHREGQSKNLTTNRKATKVMQICAVDNFFKVKLHTKSYDFAQTRRKAIV